MKNIALVLCSGGLDSVTTAHLVKKKLNFDKAIILFFNYGQRALKEERKFSRQCARDLDTEFLEVKIEDLKKISNSLINNKLRFKEVKSLKNTSKESEKWYVECRNLIFLSYALALADSIKEKCEIFVGFKCEGKDCYPDATPSFVKAFNALSRISSKSKARVVSPLIKMDKEDIILLGRKLGVNFDKTYSCYVSGGPCKKCLACKLREAGFYWAESKF